MSSIYPCVTNLEVGKLYRFDTQDQVQGVLLYEGPRPLSVGDILYCERKVGNAGFQCSLVKPCAGSQIRRVLNCRFAVDFIMREVGELSPDGQEEFMKGDAVFFDTSALPPVAMTPEARLRCVEPGAVIELAHEEGKPVRYAFVLNKTGIRNPRLSLAATADDGSMTRFSLTVSELEGATVFADASVDRFEEGRLFLLEALQPGTILRFAEPPAMKVMGDHEEKAGQYVLLERTTGRRKPEGPTFHLRVRSPRGDLTKLLANRWFLEGKLAVVGSGRGTFSR